MTQPKIYVDLKGTLLYIQDCPQEPSYSIDAEEYGIQFSAYQSALELAIKGGVKFMGQEQVKEILKGDNWHNLGELSGMYPIPSGVSVEVEQGCGISDTAVCKNIESCVCVHDDIPRTKFAILKLSDNSAHSYTEGMDVPEVNIKPVYTSEISVRLFSRLELKNAMLHASLHLSSASAIDEYISKLQTTKEYLCSTYYHPLATLTKSTK